MSSKLFCLRSARLAARHPCRRRTFASAASSRADHVRIVEVGPRDGLQNEKKTIPLATKIELVERLARTGLTTIEAGSFVSPKWVPQMANSAEILERLLSSPPHSSHPITYQWLLPNVKGFDNFLSTWQSKSQSGHDAYPTPPPSPGTDNGPALNTSSSDPNAMPSASSGADAMNKNHNSTPPIHELSIFTAATESFTQKNTNCSIAESLKRFEPIMSKAKEMNLNVRAYISVALGCPYEGPDVDPHKVAELAVSLLEMGADEISVADTTGMGTAPKTLELLKTLNAAGVDKSDLALHFHDTYGQALVNSVVALEHGIRTFDAAVGGLGGCPFSPGATGNIATEDLVHCFHSLGAKTGVDIEKLSEVGEWISQELGRPNDSRAGKATLSQLRKAMK
ncbi:hydroxymethylglutaryl-CoA lyase [Pyrenophora tritici-repentis]|uniref:hydroxymethylglutaryl-CoA lyase n=2 Tax=Pyrenophora tritici-repentis TaxID=45151 RepID=A0A2W1DJ28_9PLEO|nr:hydroxymethylglutaryl-CoA lyase [Pyrenophora tritici-repentis Pt-1C-BFP]KAA8619175.1 Hydroxymethylglutaryl-CoA lyase [Pyrenophora tritici-repentis]EDU48960.1 hydroxymethylglutaryl-CoA lyase [Pyrenophora tritici-repentis Pt-1C-BFP]KAF7449648.1 Hydroxymethylglutaryl-CoA lyase [Pyrenophora tritici-repentis]KAF7570231.1 HMGL multi-domain protein [Pyrenophora tritici-repentis]KAG9383422.1 Hydroxymethylglutaryl-CoA lyase [Pyrenophora tritici-repentis]